jgi:hypothetical protein
MTNPFAPAQPAAPAGPVNPFAQPAPAAPQGLGTPQAGQSVQQHNFVPVAASAAAPPAFDFSRLASAPAPVVGEGKGAALADMYGRLVLFFPLSISRVARRTEYITAEQRARGDLDQEQLVATVVVLDDGQGGMQPIAYGGKPYAIPSTPHTDQAPLPYVRKAMWVKQTRLISQLRDSLPAAPGGAPGMIAGRLNKTGPAQNDPWFLVGATEAEVALVRQYLELVQANQYPHPLA